MVVCSGGGFGGGKRLKPDDVINLFGGDFNNVFLSVV